MSQQVRDALHLALAALTEKADRDPSCDCSRCLAIDACRKALFSGATRLRSVCVCCNLPADECACNEYCWKQE